MVLASERMLFAAIPLVCGPILGWAVIASVGAGPAPFYLAPLLAWLYHSFTMPAPSAFRTPAGVAVNGRHGPGPLSWDMDDSLVLSPAEAAVHAVALVVVPAMTYLGTHWPTIVGDSLVRGGFNDVHGFNKVQEFNQLGSVVQLTRFMGSTNKLRGYNRQGFHGLNQRGSRKSMRPNTERLNSTLAVSPCCYVLLLTLFHFYFFE